MFVVRVLRHQLAPERFGEDGLVEMIDQLPGAGRLGRRGGAVVECVSEFTNPATFTVEDGSTRTVLLGASMT